MQLELRCLRKSLGVTFDFATHDQEEALTLNTAAGAIDWSGEGVRVETNRGIASTRAYCLGCGRGGYCGHRWWVYRPLGQTMVPVTSVQVATEPLSENVAKSILPMGHSPTDTRRLIFYFRKDAAGRLIIGGRGANRKRQAALKTAALRLYPQIGAANWSHAWGGNVAMTRDHVPGLHRIAPNVVAALGYNGRGVGMATAMGTVLAKWAQGCPEPELDFPMTLAKPIPFHRFRKVGVGATVATFRIMDRLGL